MEYYRSNVTGGIPQTNSIDVNNTIINSASDAYASNYWNIPYTDGLSPMKQIEGTLHLMKINELIYLFQPFVREFHWIRREIWHQQILPSKWKKNKNQSTLKALQNIKIDSNSLHLCCCSEKWEFLSIPFSREYIHVELNLFQSVYKLQLFSVKLSEMNDFFFFKVSLIANSQPESLNISDEAAIFTRWFIDSYFVNTIFTNTVYLQSYLIIFDGFCHLKSSQIALTVSNIISKNKP